MQLAEMGTSTSLDRSINQLVPSAPDDHLFTGRYTSTEDFFKNYNFDTPFEDPEHREMKEVNYLETNPLSVKTEINPVSFNSGPNYLEETNPFSKKDNLYGEMVLYKESHIYPTISTQTKTPSRVKLVEFTFPSDFNVGKVIYLEGSWDNFQSKKLMIFSNRKYTYSLYLEREKEYHYHFIVDGWHTYIKDLPHNNLYWYSPFYYNTVYVEGTEIHPVVKNTRENLTEFIWPNENAQTVYLELINDIDKIHMHREASYFRTSINLPWGVYHYRFLVDGIYKYRSDLLHEKLNWYSREYYNIMNVEPLVSINVFVKGESVLMNKRFDFNMSLSLIDNIEIMKSIWNLKGEYLLYKDEEVIFDRGDIERDDLLKLKIYP
jgi:hypothetical protein